MTSPAHTDSRETLDPDKPITLEEACKIEFRDTITPHSLRAEASRGRLRIFKVGRRQFTTLRDVRELCRAEPSRTSTSTGHGIPGASAMALSPSERVAILDRKLTRKRS